MQHSAMSKSQLTNNLLATSVKGLPPDDLNGEYNTREEIKWYHHGVKYKFVYIHHSAHTFLGLGLVDKIKEHQCVYFTLQIAPGAISRYKKRILFFYYSNSFGFRDLLLSTIATVAITEN